jgi:Skp family chaperone for outer membrane proteins
MLLASRYSVANCTGGVLLSGKVFKTSAFILALFVASLSSVVSAAEEQRLAVVNVSLVFEKYSKVPDVQRRIDEKFKAMKDELSQRAGELERRNKEVAQLYQQDRNSELVFDRVQKLRKDQFKFERELNNLNADIQKEYTRDMRDVLTDIRGMVRAIAEKGNFALVLRSPDTDDPETVENPDDVQSPTNADRRTHLELNAPKTVVQLVERFNRNPVLFGAKTVDITQEVLTKLNDEYLRRSILGGGKK